jgi:flagellar hook-associated protein 3 FlgL
MRAVESTWYRNFLLNLQATKGRFDKSITQTTTGKKINKFSDAPTDMAYVLTLKSKVGQVDQFQNNIKTGLSYLKSSETALNSVLNRMFEVVTLAESGASEQNGPDERAIIADQIDQIRNSVINYANSELMGNFIFSGSATNIKPFEKDPGETPPDTVIYNGNSHLRNIQADFSILVNFNIPGNEVFGVGASAPAGTVDIFQRLADLRDHLLADDTTALEGDISNFHEVMDQLNENIGKLGNRQAHLTQLSGQLSSFRNSMLGKISSLEDADMAKAISDLTQEEIGLQATLNAGARIGRTSLFNFLG